LTNKGSWLFYPKEFSNELSIIKNWNSFGLDYKKYALPAGDIYTEELGALDSDGDGFSNSQEFDANTNPGDPKSKPEK
jgi:hypothetical protein